MSWLIVSILSYLVLAIVYLADKYLLTGPIPNPKVYAFYIGVLGILFLILAPFLGFHIPEVRQIILGLLAGAFFIYGLFWLFKALQLFEPSRVVPAVGGILPIFSFLLIYLFLGGKEILKSWEFLAFVLLILGSVLITYQKTKRITLRSLKISAIAALFLAFYFVSAKYVYMEQPFWSGFFWIRIGAFFMALGFLLTPGLRKELSETTANFQKKTAGIFLFNQVAGAGAHVLQNWAIALAPLAYIPIINTLQGTQYVFLLVFAILFSFKFPQILKEEISKEVIFQKLLAILLIGGGLTLFALK